MPDKKLTDSEIVKALECCRYDDYDYCKECPYRKNKPCQENLIQDTFDLINRLQAENEELVGNNDRLKAELFEKTEHLKTAKAENERLNRNLDTISRACKQRRDEAVKEFVEKVCDEIIDAIINNGKVIKERIEKHNVNRLEDNFCCMCDGKIRALSGIEYFIKDLLKELVGDN